MRVAFIARYLQPLNQQKVAALARQPGIEVWHLTPRQWTDAFRTYEQSLPEPDDYRRVTLETWPHSSDIHRFIYWPASLCIGRIKPDIIHLEEEPDSLVALQIVLVRHIWARSARLILFTWQNIARPRSAFVQWLMAFVLQHVDCMIAGNTEAAQVLRVQGFKRPIHVLPQLGVDTERFRPGNGSAMRERLGLTQFVVGYVGRFAPEKGIDILLRASAQIPDVQLLLVGAGPQQPKLEALAQALGLTARLKFVNAVPHDDLPVYLNCMDVLVLPSRATPDWKEQFGHVLIEAMACGVPVIGSESGAIPEVIGSAGLLFPEGNAAELAAGVRKIIQSKAIWEDLRQRGVRRVSEHYTHQCIAESTWQIYQACMPLGGR